MEARSRRACLFGLGSIPRCRLFHVKRAGSDATAATPMRALSYLEYPISADRAATVPGQPANGQADGPDSDGPANADGLTCAAAHPGVRSNGGSTAENSSAHAVGQVSHVSRAEPC
jgi:hypothetical protein